jgi:hypothetical protein
MDDPGSRPFFRRKPLLITASIVPWITPAVVILAVDRHLQRELERFCIELLTPALYLVGPLLLLYLSVRVFDPRPVRSPENRIQRIWKRLPIRRPIGLILKCLGIIHAVGAIWFSRLLVEDPAALDDVFPARWVAWLFVLWLWMVVPVAYMAGEALMRRPGAG